MLLIDKNTENKAAYANFDFFFFHCDREGDSLVGMLRFLRKSPGISNHVSHPYSSFNIRFLRSIYVIDCVDPY